MTGTEPHKLRRNDHPDTSHKAAEQVDTARFEELAYQIILEYGPRGCILDDLEDGFAVRAPKGTQCANRRTGLHQKGLVLDTGTRRVGRKGREQAVYVARELLTEEWIGYIKQQSLAQNPCLFQENQGPKGVGNKLDLAREAFLALIADAKRWDEDPDEGTLDYHLTTSHHQLSELIRALGIPQRFDESPGDAIQRELEKP